MSAGSRARDQALLKCLKFNVKTVTKTETTGASGRAGSRRVASAGGVLSEVPSPDEAQV